MRIHSEPPATDRLAPPATDCKLLSPSDCDLIAISTRDRLQAALTGTRDGMDLCGRAVPECLGARDDGDGPSTRLRRHGRGGSDESAWACRPVTTDHVRGRLQRVLSLGGRCVMCMHGQYRHRALCMEYHAIREKRLKSHKNHVSRRSRVAQNRSQDSRLSERLKTRQKSIKTNNVSYYI